MTSPFLRPCSCANPGWIQAVVSQVIFVSGFASSCSRPMLATRPSQIVGSGRKTIPRPPAIAGALLAARGGCARVTGGVDAADADAGGAGCSGVGDVRALSAAAVPAAAAAWVVAGIGGGGGFGPGLKGVA